MKQCYVTFRSITQAQRGREILEKDGISVELLRTPRNLQEKGCGYHLSVPESCLARALLLLRGGQAAYSRVYCKKADGIVEERL